MLYSFGQGDRKACMFVRPFHSVLKVLIAALVGLAFVMAPVASAQHSEAIAEAVCELETGEEHTSGDAGGHGDHDHQHVSGCGGCHIHLIEPDVLQRQEIGPSRSVYRTSPAASWGHALPGGLFRPPRS